MADSDNEYDSLKNKKKIDDIAQEYVREKGNVGLAVGIIDGDHENTLFYGSLARDSETPPDENTVFEIGSIGKVFTAVLLAEMAERGEVNLDDPIEKHLPPDVAVPKFRGKSITLEHLATHTSGLPRLPGNLSKTVTVSKPAPIPQKNALARTGGMVGSINRDPPGRMSKSFCVATPTAAKTIAVP